MPTESIKVTIIIFVQCIGMKSPNSNAAMSQTDATMHAMINSKLSLIWRFIHFRQANINLFVDLADISD